MRNRLGPSKLHRLQSGATPATGADVTVGDNPENITAVLHREAASAHRRQAQMMRHDEDCTPIGWGFALFMMAYLAGCIGLVFLIVAQLTAIYWP